MWTKLFAITLIPSVVVMVIISFILGRILRGKPYKIKMIPIVIIGLILFLLEIIKQAIGIYSGYDLVWLPFHICSLFIFIIGIMGLFYGKLKDNVRIAITVITEMIFLFMLINPTIIYSESSILNFTKDFFSFHTVFFHNLVLFAFLLMINLCEYKFNTKRDLVTLFSGLLIFLIISASMANILKVNYGCFYFSPTLFIEKIRLGVVSKCGVFGQCLYVLGSILLILLASFVAYWILRLFVKLIKNKK